MVYENVQKIKEIKEKYIEYIEKDDLEKLDEIINEMETNILTNIIADNCINLLATIIEKSLTRTLREAETMEGLKEALDIIEKTENKLNEIKDEINE